jgi:DNA-binding PadR family transcriptional regulator
MTRIRKLSPQTVLVLTTLANRPSDWLYGLELAKQTELKSGSLYPILIRLADRGLLDSCWLESKQQGRPPRHAYRISAAGLKTLAKEEPSPTSSLRELRT